MFYSNNNGYMEDLYYYNQMPNNTYMNPGNNMLGNPVNYNFGNWENPNYSNPNVFNPNTMQTVNPRRTPIQNLNSLYPSIYRIINPVVSRVISNGNNQFINEDALNNMTDTVFNIVEGQIELDEDIQTQRNLASETQTNTNSSNNSLNTNSLNNNSSRTIDNTRNANQAQSSNNIKNNRNESLLRDLIKILILKELFARNCMQRQINFPANNTYNPFF